MKYSIKKITAKNISKNYLRTINHRSTKKFIQFAKKGKLNKTKIDLVNYVKNLPKNEILYGIYKDNKHVANFKITIKKHKIYIGFLVFFEYQGKGIIHDVFNKILRLKQLERNKSKFMYLGVDKKNSRAINLYKKLGFKYQRNSQKIMYINLKKF